MLCRKPGILALLILASVFGPPPAAAGTTAYSWGSIGGYGYEVTYPDNQFLSYTTGNGSLLIGYDPDDLSASYIAVSTGSAGYSVYAYSDFTISASSYGVDLSAAGDDGQWASVFLPGDPGALDGSGNPESLASLIGDRAYVGAQGGDRDRFYFNGQAVPEPSGLVLGLIGLATFAAASVMRRRRRPLDPAPGGRSNEGVVTPRGGTGRASSVS